MVGIRIADRESGSLVILPADQTKVLGFSWDGKKLATRSKENALFVWDTVSGNRFFSLTMAGTGLRWSPFNRLGDRIRARQRTDKSYITIFDSLSGKPFQRLDHNAPSIMVIGSNASETLLAGGGIRGKVTLWDGRTGEFIRDVGEHRGVVESLAFSPDGSRLASASYDRTAIIWDVAKGTRIATLAGHSGLVRDVTFSPDGELLATGSADRTARVWSMQTFEELGVFSGHDTTVGCVAFDPNGRSLVTGEKRGTVRIWNVEGIGSDTLSRTGQGAPDLAVRPNQTEVAAAVRDGTLRFWDLQTRAETRRIEVPRGKDLKGVAYSNDGSYVCAASSLLVRWWDLRTDAPPIVVDINSRGGNVHRQRPGFCPDGSTLAVPNFESVDLYNTDDGTLVKQLRIQDSKHKYFHEASYSPDGALIAARAGKALYVWDARSYSRLDVLGEQSDSVAAFEFSSDSSTLASANRYAIQLWSTDNFESVANISLSSEACSVAFKPDGTRLAIGCGDGTIRLVDMHKYEEVATLLGHQDAVRGLRFTPDGNQLISSAGGTIRIWDGSPADG